jgi:hypothetical protein
MDTTCNRVQRFTHAGVYVQTVWTDRDANTVALSHGFAVSWNGSILLPTPSTLLTRLDPPVRGGGPGPAPGCHDTAAPRVVGVTGPARTDRRTITIAVTATDDCTGVSATRVSGSVTAATAVWRPGMRSSVTLTGWNGDKTLLVQVRDGAGHSTARRVTVTLALPQPALVARRTVNLGGSGCSSIPPMRRVGGASAYVLVDRCARITGRVLSVAGGRTSGSIELSLPVTAARAIYANAVGPVHLWIITDGHTVRTGHIARGARVAVVTSLIATRRLDAAFAIPSDLVSAL